MPQNGVSGGRGTYPEEEDQSQLGTVELLKSALPALGIWLASPMMSLIDSAVVGRSDSSLARVDSPGTGHNDRGLLQLPVFISWRGHHHPRGHSPGQ